jgi:hypothetical protein
MVDELEILYAIKRLSVNKSIGFVFNEMHIKKFLALKNEPA